MHTCFQVSLSQQRNLVAALCSRVIKAFIAVSLTTAMASANAAQDAPSPDTRYSPQQVVQIVVESLQVNAEDDAGIATVFRFASPGNKASTGPLERFTQLLKRGFPAMLNHAGVRYDPMEITGDTAVQAVWISSVEGAETGYAFKLGKHSGGPMDGMWLTDAVIPLGKGKQDGIGI